MLDNALDLGISERDFWDMTLAELDRLAKSKQRVEKVRQQERAMFDYIHASLVGRSVGRSISGGTFPDIYEVYPTIFDAEEREEQQRVARDKLSALRFRQFAQSFNSRYKEVAND